MDFFTKDELEFFKSIAGSPYQANHEESERKGERLKPIIEKSNYWADLLNERLPGFRVENNRRWITGKTFRRYTWHKIYRPKDEDKLIFFTIGVDGDGGNLLMKLDCMREINGQGEVLSKKKIDRFFETISGHEERRYISKDELNLWSWHRLISYSERFVREHIDLYEDAIESVHEASDFSERKESNSELIGPSEKPSRIKSNLLGRERTFNGVVTDWEKEYNRSQRLGLAGEEFIIREERLKLKKADLHKLAKDVKKVKDGKGYDIRSFDDNGKEVHIEVKTTTGGNHTPFYMSENERAYMGKMKGKYSLYRVYNFDRVIENGDYFVISGTKLIDNGSFNPISYEVSYRAK